MQSVAFVSGSVDPRQFGPFKHAPDVSERRYKVKIQMVCACDDWQTAFRPVQTYGGSMRSETDHAFTPCSILSRTLADLRGAFNPSPCKVVSFSESAHRKLFDGLDVFAFA